MEITSPSPITEFVLSPKSRNLTATAAGNVLSFTVDAPGYFILQIPGQERIFVLLDPPEVDAPVLGAPNVQNVMDIEGMDNMGTADVTALVQAAIDAASGAEKNIVYFPPGLYATKALYLRNDMTLYLADGAVLQNITTTGDVLSQVAELATIEGSNRGYIVMNGVRNAKVMGRGTIDGNGVPLKESGKKMYLMKIENSTDCVVDGIIARDSVFWSTLVYRSDNISISNYKIINNRLSDTDYNETDGVDFNNTTNSTLKNAFLYTGDDCMAVKSDDIPDDDDFVTERLNDPSTGPYINVDNLLHETIVCFSASAGCKVGTKTMGHTMNNIVFRDVDIVAANRGLVIDGADTASITGTVFENIRVEQINSGRLIDFALKPEDITWRYTPGLATVTGVSVIDVTSEVSAQCRIAGNAHDGGEYFIDGVSFTNFVVEGNVITSVDDPNASFDINEYVTNITFD